MAPINQPNPSDRNSRLRAQKDQEESLNKLVKNFGGLISESTKFQTEKNRNNAKDIITSNEDVTLLSAEAVVKEVEKSSLISSKTAGEFDTKINKKVPRFARDMLLSMGESRIKTFQGFRDLFRNMTSIFPNRAARERSRRVQINQLKELGRDIDKLNQAKLQTHWLEKISTQMKSLSQGTKTSENTNNLVFDFMKKNKRETVRDKIKRIKATMKEARETNAFRKLQIRFLNLTTRTTEQQREEARRNKNLGIIDPNKDISKLLKGAKGSKRAENLINIPLFGLVGTLSATVISLLFDTLVSGLTNAFFEKKEDMQRFLESGTAIPGVSVGKILAVGKGAAAGAAVGAWIGRGIAGPVGIVAGLLIGGAVGGLFKALTTNKVGEKSKQSAKEMLSNSISSAKGIGILALSVYGGAKVGALVGSAFGPIGIIVGAILGAATGGIIAYFSSNDVLNLVDNVTKKTLIAMGIVPDRTLNTPDVNRIQGFLKTATSNHGLELPFLV